MALKVSKLALDPKEERKKIDKKAINFSEDKIFITNIGDKMRKLLKNKERTIQIKRKFDF